MQVLSTWQDPVAVLETKQSEVTNVSTVLGRQQPCAMRIPTISTDDKAELQQTSGMFTSWFFKRWFTKKLVKKKSLSHLSAQNSELFLGILSQQCSGEQGRLPQSLWPSSIPTSPGTALFSWLWETNYFYTYWYQVINLGETDYCIFDLKFREHKYYKQVQ